MAATDDDAPRRGANHADGDVDSLDALASTRADKQSPLADVDEGDNNGADDLPDAILTGEDLSMPVVLQRNDEFTYIPCFLVQNRSRLARGFGTTAMCIDCS